MVAEIMKKGNEMKRAGEKNQVRDINKMEQRRCEERFILVN